MLQINFWFQSSIRSMIRAQCIVNVAIPIEFRNTLFKKDVAEIRKSLLKFGIFGLQMLETVRENKKGY